MRTARVRTWWQLSRRAAERATAVGVRLALEPLNRYETDIVNNAARVWPWWKKSDTRAWGCLDTFHMNIEETQYDAAIRSLARAGRLFHVHHGRQQSPGARPGPPRLPDDPTSLCAVGYHGYLSAELLAQAGRRCSGGEHGQHMRSLLHTRYRRDATKRRDGRTAASRHGSATRHSSRYSEADVKLGIGTYAYMWAIGFKFGDKEARPEQPMTAFDLLRRTHELGLHVVQ